ncbi:MAG: metallophosphoesterase [Hyphomicrobiaceae bacterium]
MKQAKIAILGDVHHGPPTATKCGEQALSLLEGALRAIEAEKPDLVLDMGDRINDIDPQTDRRLLREVAEVFAGVTAPRVHLLGNHDMCFMDRAANEAALGTGTSHHVRDLGAWRLVVFQPTVEIRRPGGFAPIDQADIEWLATTLGMSDQPAMIVSHVPVSGHAMASNYYFDGRAEFSTYPNREAVLDLLDATVAPVAWLSGHVHWNTCIQVAGVPHFTIQSLSESFTTGGEAAGAWGTLTLSADGIDLALRGNDPIAIKLPMPRRGPKRWPMR